MDPSNVRARRRKSLFRPWNSHLAKRGAIEATEIAKQLDEHRANAKEGRVPYLTPLVRLSVKLLETYEGINDAYYERNDSHKPQSVSPSTTATHPQSSAPFVPPSHPPVANSAASSAARTASPLSIQYCDENYDYIVRTGEMFNNRYMLEKVIGRGSFGQVVRAFDTCDNTHVAIKIIKNNSLYVEQALSEVRMTSYLNRIDPEDVHYIMRLRDKFIFRGHQCLVLELLSFSLYDLLRSTEFYGVSLNLVRKFSKQILTCLAFLARPDVNIAHCDLKPENVLLRHPQRSAIKVVDFGASCRISESMFVYVQSRFYRSPEVILGLPYNTQVDVWSLGCMLIELHTGYPVFAGRDEGDQIAIIVERLGMPPTHMLEQGKKTNLFFEQDSSTGEWKLKPNISEDHGSNPPGCKPIEAFVDFHTGAVNGRRKRESGGHSEADYEIFLALAAKMLQYDPKTRISAEEALSDAFVRGAPSRSGRESPPPIPAMGAVGDHVADDLDPGRQAPLQPRRDVIGGTRSHGSAGSSSSSSSRGGGGGGGSSGSSGGSGSTGAGRRTGQNDGSFDDITGVDDLSSDVGGKLRLSKSEPAMDPAVPKRTFVFRTSDWAEEVGIEPPPWRAGGTCRPDFGGDGGAAMLVRAGTADVRRSLGAAGGGQRLTRRKRAWGTGRWGGGGNGTRGSSGDVHGGGGGECGGSSGARVGIGGEGRCTGVAWQWERRRGREQFEFGIGAARVNEVLRRAGANGGRGVGVGAWAGRGLHAGLGRGHGSALLLSCEYQT